MEVYTGEFEKGRILSTLKEYFSQDSQSQKSPTLEKLNDDGKSAQPKVTNDIDNNDGSWPNEENITEMSKKNCNTDEMGEHGKDGQEWNESIPIENEEDDKSEDNLVTWQSRVVRDVFNEIFDKTNAEVARKSGSASVNEEDK
ncbi:hypothetical protein AgCh_019898 [Apium graveolens]